MKHRFSTKFAAATLLSLACTAVYAQPAGEPDSATTVVTLYSHAQPVAGAGAGSDAQPPIRIVNGGVKSAGDSCWKLSDAGEVITQPGDCYVLRSAAPGEKPPVQ